MKRLALFNKPVGVLRIIFGPDKFSGLSGNGPLLVIMKVLTLLCNELTYQDC